jgi:hypothetical protein
MNIDESSLACGPFDVVTVDSKRFARSCRRARSWGVSSNTPPTPLPLYDEDESSIDHGVKIKDSAALAFIKAAY